MLSQYRCLVVSAEVISPSEIMCHIGILVGSELLMKQHIAKITAVCFHHLCRLCYVRSTTKLAEWSLYAGNGHVVAGLLKLCAGSRTKVCD